MPAEAQIATYSRLGMSRRRSGLGAGVEGSASLGGLAYRTTDRLSDKLLQSRPRDLARLMGLGPDIGDDWRADELGAVFQHQWHADLAEGLSALAPGVSTRVQFVANSHDPPIRTFGDLFTCHDPPAKLLDLTRRFAKSCSRRPSVSIPTEVAAALYFLSIAAAITRCDRWITRLDTEAVRDGVAWLRDRDWVTPQARELSMEALEGTALKGSPGPSCGPGAS